MSCIMIMIDLHIHSNSPVCSIQYAWKLAIWLFHFRSSEFSLKLKIPHVNADTPCHADTSRFLWSFDIHIHNFLSLIIIAIHSPHLWLMLVLWSLVQVTTCYGPGPRLAAANCRSWAGARVWARAVGAGVTRRNFAAPDIWTFVSLGIKE